MSTLAGDGADAQLATMKGGGAGGWRNVLLIIAVLILAIGIRVWLIAQPGIGHQPDIEIFVRWMRGLTERSLGGFYAGEPFCDYPPLMLLLFRGAGGAVRWIAGAGYTDAQLVIGLKSLATLAEFLLGGLLFVEGRRLGGTRAGLLAGGLFLLNPVALYDSVYWGQVDSIQTLFSVAAVSLACRRRWMLSGAMAALGLGAKFQAIVFVPLVVLECYRVARWRGLVKAGVGALLAASAVAGPLLAANAFRESFSRAYVRVIGQYNERSKNAYNLWVLLGDAEANDSAVPDAILRTVADGRESMPANESWLLTLTVRRISLALFAAAVAIVLSLYSRRPGRFQIFAAGGLLALAFFLFPTEMHERYGYPAIAFLAVWAVQGVRAERVYWLVTILMLLNLAAVLPPAALEQPIAVAFLLGFGLLLLMTARRPPLDAPGVCATEVGPEQSPPEPCLIAVFRRTTAIGVALLVIAGAAIGILVSRAPAAPNRPDAIWLSTISPRSASQGWRKLAIDRSVDGAELRLGDSIYLRGIGTHAPARLVYDIPAGVASFDALVGVNADASPMGSAVVRVVVDDRRVVETARLSPQSSPVSLHVPLGAAKLLTLVIDPTEDGKRSDQVDFALARLMLTDQE
ncbi:MAG: NPCBM/NEW2 domain-containing protein [Planctomycetes bacterium]|nr:NPCBM/NEW2 domain-containing protein [Planctomycetota bacterium]